MSFFKVIEPLASGAVEIPDLGVSIGSGATVILSDQFNVKDLYLSGDLEGLIIAGTLDVELDFGTGFTAVSSGDYTNRDALASFMNIYEVTNENNNEDLVDGSEVNSSGPGSTPLHVHDARYYTETELGNTSGGGLIGVDTSGCSFSSATTAQVWLQDLCAAIGAVDLDDVYDNDSDGIMNVDQSSRNLDFRSDNANDIKISRINTTVQDVLVFDVSSDELFLGALSDANNNQVDVHVLSNLVVDGDITFTGTITDTTVNELNVTNAKIFLRDGAATGADASIEVERGSTGADACILWNETTDRWQVGIVGTKFTIAAIDRDEDISGNWCFAGAGATSPNYCMVEKPAAPTVDLGAAGEIPIAMLPNGIMAVYDKSNSRNKFLSVQREFMTFSGRDNPNNKDEYARIGDFTSNQAGGRLIRNATLVGISLQTNSATTWTAEVRRNNSVTVLDSLASGGAAGAQSGAKNTDFDAGDQIQVYINSGGVNIDRPLIRLEFAYRF